MWLRTILQPSFLVLAAVLLSAASLRAENAAAPVVREIGEVVVLTPSGASGAPRALYTDERVRAWLGGFVGDPFEEHEVRRKIARHYEYLGYLPSIRIAFSEGRLGVTIVEAPCVVEEVALGPDSLRGHVDSGLLEGLEPIDRPHVVTRALRTSEGQLLNHECLARDEYDLSRLGYDIVRIPSAPTDIPASRLAVTRRPRLRDWRGARDRVGEYEAGARPREEGGLPEPGAGLAVTPGKIPAEDAGIQPDVEPLRLGWLSTEAEYTRRSLVVARLFYERAHLFREFDSVEVSPYVAQQLAGAIRYRLPYILPASVTTWNLFADVKLYDEFVPDRLLEGVETDERRAGARVTMGLEPWVNQQGHSLRGSLWVDRYHVTFGQFQIPVNGGIAPRSANVPGGRLNDVNLLGIEMRYAFHHEFRAPRFWWELRPRAEVATKAWGGDTTFKRASGELRQHYAWSPGLELDMSWKGGIVDRDAPIFEEFALGGATSLRGFLRDDFLGRRFWSAQNDLWVPIPFRAMAPGSSLMSALQRNLKTALIFDAGSVSYEETLDVRFARGVGLGLRWQAEGSPLVVRADAAWGYWRGERRFYPYLSFTRSW